MSYIELEKKKLENKFAEAGNRYMAKILQICQEYNQEKTELSDSYKAILEEEKSTKPVEETEKKEEKK